MERESEMVAESWIEERSQESEVVYCLANRLIDNRAAIVQLFGLRNSQLKAEIEFSRECNSKNAIGKVLSLPDFLDKDRGR